MKSASDFPLNIVIIGRTNVGKSTLFNRLTGSQQAIVWNEPGVTRDRHTQEVLVEEHRLCITDTGGLMDDLSEPHQAGINEQAIVAMKEADLIVLMMDARFDVQPQDHRLADLCRKTHSAKTIVAVNKTDGLEPQQAMMPFFVLGFESVLPIAAHTGRGVRQLMHHCLEVLGCQRIVSSVPDEGVSIPDPEVSSDENLGHNPEVSSDESLGHKQVSVALVGQPNAGKSTLTNRLAKENRVLVSPEAGTTRDAIATQIQHKNRDFCIIDTAGIPRRKNNKTALSKITFLKNQSASRTADVVIILLDATSPLSDQDSRILNSTIRTYQPCVVALNRWDLLSAKKRESVRLHYKEQLHFMFFVPIVPISATTGYGVNALMREVDRVYVAQKRQHTTSKLTRVLEQALANHPPPYVQGRRVNLRFAHPKENNALHIVIRGKQTQALPLSYRRYLVHFFYHALGHVGSKMKIEWINDENPYAPVSQKKISVQQKKISVQQKKISAQQKKISAHR
jgi:GTPase